MNAATPVRVSDVEPSPDPVLAKVARRMRRLLLASPMRDRRSWPYVAIICESTTPVISTRAELATWFRANDLPTLAEKVTTIRVPSGCVVVWLNHGLAESEGAWLATFNLETCQLRVA
jgi:hypothetical protein